MVWYNHHGVVCTIWIQINTATVYGPGNHIDNGSCIGHIGIEIHIDTYFVVVVII